jgi:serine/threonine protein phosphatase 1
MIRTLIERLIGGAATSRAALSPRHRRIDTIPAVTYAIGDVHGCLDELLALEAKIKEDSAAIEGKKLLVMLGDYVDRGPQSAGVIDHLLAPPPRSFERICLMGNHELMANAFFERPEPRSDWLQFGGIETLHSYGLPLDALSAASPSRRRQTVDAYLPQEHREFLRSLDWTLSLPGWLFVHAGLRPGVPLEQQHPDDLFWIREEFFEGPPLHGVRIVHGHTPAPEPVVTPSRICIDTGAFATGRLTAIRVTPDGAFSLLQTP